MSDIGDSDFSPDDVMPGTVQAPEISPDDPTFQAPSIMGGVDFSGGDIPVLGQAGRVVQAPDIGSAISINPADPAFAPPGLGLYGSGALSPDQPGLIARSRNFNSSASDHDMVLGNGALDTSARQNMPALDRTNRVNSTNENFAQFKTGDDGGVAFTPKAGTTTMSGNTAVGTFGVDPDADAIGHSHPLASGFSIVPGPDDNLAVEQGKPNYIVHDGNVIVVEKNDGQYQARLIAGQLNPADRVGIQNALDSFQAGGKRSN